MIAIKNLEMPSTANNCKFFQQKNHTKNRTFFCLITGKRQAIYKYSDGKPDYRVKRCDNCPLVDVIKPELLGEK